MSLFARRRQTSPNDGQRMFGGYFSSSNQLIPTRPPMATAGIPVTPTTAIQKVALMAATNLVANMPNLLEPEGFSGHGGTTKPVTLPTNVLDPEAQGYGLSDFGYKYLTCLILRGNAFIRVDKVDPQSGRPSVVTLLDPDEIQTKRDPKTGAWVFVGLEGDPMPRFGVGAMEGGMIHRRSFASPGKLLGQSVIVNHARTLGLSIASEQFAADFFSDGAHPSGILTSNEPVTESQAKAIKARFVNAIRGSREPAMLGAGVKYQAIQIAPAESQFLEAQKFTAAECCRMVGPGIAEMLGYDTGTSMTYQNVDARSLHLLIYAIDPWLRNLEGLVSNIFLPRSQYMEFDRNGLLRMTARDRWMVYTLQLKAGARVINEVRGEENESPVPWGDSPYLPALGPAAAAAAENGGDAQPTGGDPALTDSEGTAP